MTQFHVSLGQKKRGRNDITITGLARTVALGVGVLAGVSVYIVVAFAVSARLHLDGSAAYWMSAGVLCLLVTAVGWARYLARRRLENLPGERWIALYVLVIGVGMFGFGLWRQIAVAEARRRCREALEAAEDVQARLRVYRSTERIPSLDSKIDPPTLTCERLLHS